MIKKRKKELATREREDEKLQGDDSKEMAARIVTLLDGARLEQLRRRVPVVNLSSLPRVFEWSVVPGPDTLQ